MRTALFIICVLLVGVILTFAPLLYITARVIDFSDPDDVKATKIHAYIMSDGHISIGDWGGLDIWQPPLFTVIRGAGDCEDWAILEWTLFRLAGLDATLVFGKLHGVNHMWMEWQDKTYTRGRFNGFIPDPNTFQPIFKLGPP